MTNAPMTYAEALNIVRDLEASHLKPREWALLRVLRALLTGEVPRPAGRL